MIREYRAEDSPSVVAIWRAASDMAHPFLTSDFQAAEAENVRHVYPKFAEIWVKQMSGEVVGFIALIGNEVGAIFLAPRLHGKGIGRELMEFAVARKGAVTVQVFKDNAIGRRFYDRYGLVPTGETIHAETGQTLLTLAYGPTG
jgi:putative acetyltransferase